MWLRKPLGKLHYSLECLFMPGYASCQSFYRHSPIPLHSAPFQCKIGKKPDNSPESKNGFTSKELNKKCSKPRMTISTSFP